jgi:hypothetical protein
MLRSYHFLSLLSFHRGDGGKQKKRRLKFEALTPALIQQRRRGESVRSAVRSLVLAAV